MGGGVSLASPTPGVPIAESEAEFVGEWDTSVIDERPHGGTGTITTSAICAA